MFDVLLRFRSSKITAGSALFACSLLAACSGVYVSSADEPYQAELPEDWAGVLAAMVPLRTEGASPPVDAEGLQGKETKLTRLTSLGALSAASSISRLPSPASVGAT